MEKGPRLTIEAAGVSNHTTVFDLQRNKPEDNATSLEFKSNTKILTRCPTVTTCETKLNKINKTKVLMQQSRYIYRSSRTFIAHALQKYYSHFFRTHRAILLHAHGSETWFILQNVRLPLSYTHIHGLIDSDAFTGIGLCSFNRRIFM